MYHFVTCGLTACTPGSAPGPTLGNEYGKTLPFTVKPLNWIALGPDFEYPFRHPCFVLYVNGPDKWYPFKRYPLREV